MAFEATVVERGVVACRPGQMYGWPGIIRARSGEWLVIASERKHHVCPYGREVIMRSRDGGHTWSLPEEIYDSEIDDRDGSLTLLPDGTVVAAWFTSAEFREPLFSRPEWEPRSRRVTPQMIAELEGSWILRSFDGGATWESTAHRIPEAAAIHSGPFALSDNSLISFETRRVEDGLRNFCVKSRDRGLTWERLGEMPCERYERGGMLVPYCNERAFIEADPARYVALFRNEKEGYLHQSESYDGGRTWSEARPTPIKGFPAHLLTLSGGAIMCSYGHRFDPWSIRAVFSYDGGRTWDTDHLVTLDQWHDLPDMGYPVSGEVAPGEVLTVYYVSRRPLKHMPHWETTFKHGSTPEGILFCRTRLSVR